MTRDDIFAATASVAPSLKILDTRILRVDTEIKATCAIVDTIAGKVANTRIASLAKRLAHYGEGLRAGAIVLSGSFIRPMEATFGSSSSAYFNAFGQVNVDFE